MKILRRLILLLVLLVVVGAAAAILLIPSASRRAVEEGGRYALGVETRIDAPVLSMRLGSTRLGFQGLEVQNPTGIEGDPFLHVGHFEIHLRTLSLLSSTVRVPEITLADLQLNLIQEGRRSNFKEILGHVQALGGAPSGSAPEGSSAGAAGASPAGDSSGSGASLILGSVHIENVGVSFSLSGVPGLEPKQLAFELPDFDLDLASALERLPSAGSSSAGGTRATVGEVVSALTDELTRRSLDELRSRLDPKVAALLDGDIGDALKQRAGQELEQAKEKASAAGNELKQKVEEELGQKLEQSGPGPKELEKKAKGKLKGLLGGG